MQNLNIGGAKSEHREVQNLNIGSANSEHHIYNNTNSNNTNLSNTQSVSLTAVPFSGKQKIDRLTDIKSERKQFSNVLTSIGIHYEDKISHEPQNEQDFQYCDENDRNTQSCTIPYTLKSDKAAMQETLKYLFAYSFNTAEMSKETKNLLTEVISTLSAMTETDIQEYQGERVRYSDVIDRINIIIHNSYLIDWFFSFEEKWKQILSDKKIKYQRAYMKSCIWNWLKDYQFEEDNQTRLLDYEFNPKSREQQFEQEYACMLNNF